MMSTERVSTAEAEQLIDLQPFCSKEEWRRNLDKPFTRGGYTWATNGHVMLRVIVRPEIPDTDGAPNVIKVFEDFFNGEHLRPVITGTLPQLVLNEEEECEECEGTGNPHVCPSCSCICEECYGKGFLESSSDDNVSLSIGEAIFALRYIRLIQSLPDLHIQSDPPKTNAMSFSFSGGAGLLMPMRGTYATHLKISV